MIRKIFKAIAIIMLMLVVDMYVEVSYPKLNAVSIPTDKITANAEIRLLQISDLHDKSFGKSNNRLLKLISKTPADAIVITGDLIDGSTIDFGNVYTFIEELIKINPNVYFVSGNHEWRQGEIEKLLIGLGDRGVTIVNNSGKVFEKGSLKINICGVDDSYTRHDKIHKAMESIDMNAFTVLLSHSPDIIYRMEEYKPDLILSGHTHGGQVRFPIVGAVVAPGQGYFPKLDQGIFNINDSTTLYIDSGVGTSVYPIRFMNRSQISLITISGISDNNAQK